MAENDFDAFSESWEINMIGTFIQEKIFLEKLANHHDELRWFYMELYHNDSMFAELCDKMRQFYLERNRNLKSSDQKRESDKGWYQRNDMLGMLLYIDNFAGNMKGVEDKLDYIEQCQVNYIRLMPFLDTPLDRSDGGYAVSDFRKVQERLGTMEDLEDLTDACFKHTDIAGALRVEAGNQTLVGRFLLLLFQ